MTLFRLRVFIPLLIVSLVATGCTDATDPGLDTGDGGTGTVDPGSGTFLLKSLDVRFPDGDPIRLELVGSDLVLERDGEHVSLSVALRNAGLRPLPAPTVVWLSRFDPASVFVAAPDTSLPTASILPVDGYIYEAEFGADGELAPGETSDIRRWSFRTPDQAPFSFGINIGFGPDPAGAAISGVCFWDENRNGIRGDGEPPLLDGLLTVVAPDSSRSEVWVGVDGRYVYELRSAGLHQLRHELVTDTAVDYFAPLAYSTPNPLQVLVTTGVDGQLLGYDAADFGAHVAVLPGPSPIQFTDLPPDSLHQAMWTLVGFKIVDGDRAVIDVGFSGCDPEHRFSLWMSGGFMESFPVQANIVLVHETHEICLAWWQREYEFDLSILADRFRQTYDDEVLILNLIDTYGFAHPVRWELDDRVRSD